MDKRLNGKIALITGGTTGIGLATAKRFAVIAPLAEPSLSDFDEMWNLNVRGLWLALQHAMPILSEGAAVIVNTSIAGQGAYAATKAALRSIVRTAANELAARNVRVNAISPGPIETPILGKMGVAETFRIDASARVPLGRFGSADEVASAAAFLASQDASFITGAELAVDGGLAQV